MINDIRIEHNHDDAEVTIKSGNYNRHLITIGRGSYIVQAYMDYGDYRANILIGRYCSIAHRVVFEIGLNHPHQTVTTYPFKVFGKYQVPDDTDYYSYSYSKNHYQIIIGNDVWIGEGVKILGGVHIGNGAVIGMGAVVSKDIPPYAIAVGNPARVVKYRFDKDVVSELEKIKWWNWDEKIICDRYNEMQDIHTFIDKYGNAEINNATSGFAEAMDKMRGAGGRIFYFVLDCYSTSPRWNYVIDAFMDAYLNDESKLLIIDIPKSIAEHDNFYEIDMVLDNICNNNMNIIKVVTEAGDYTLLQHSDVYICGTDIRSLSYVDMAESADVEIKSACDWLLGLF